MNFALLAVVAPRVASLDNRELSSRDATKLPRESYDVYSPFLQSVPSCLLGGKLDYPPAPRPPPRPPGLKSEDRSLGALAKLRLRPRTSIILGRASFPRIDIRRVAITTDPRRST